MDFDREVRWATRANSLLDRVRSGRLTERQKSRLPLEVVEQRLGGLDEYRLAASVWLKVILVGQRIVSLVRRTG